MRISVIIPAVNEASCIQHAVRSCWTAGVDEVIVADGGSNDDTPRLATQEKANVVYGNRGRAVQQNLGASHATGNVLLFLHADNRLSPDIGNQIRSYLREPRNLAGAFYQRIESERWLFRLLERGNAARARHLGMAYGDQAIFMRRETFDRLRGFPSVMLMEDLLLMRAFRKLGKLTLLPGPVYVHPRRWQKRGIIRQTLRNWTLTAVEKLGVSPNRLAKYYPAHDQLLKRSDSHLELADAKLE